MSTPLGQATTTVRDQKDLKEVVVDRPSLLFRQDVTLNYSYVGDANFKSGPGGHLGEQTTEFGYHLMAPLHRQFSLQFGLNYSRLDFGQPTGSPLPYNLQTISTSLGAEYKLLDQWRVFGLVVPRLELIDNANQIESQDFAVGGALGATYDPNNDLSIRFGLAINPGALDAPVLPILGVRWNFAKAWTLNAGFPRTSIDYQFLPNFRLSPIGMGFEGGSFHTSKSYGNAVGMTQLNDRKLTYNEVRVGTVADYGVLKNLDVELTAGAVVYRDFDFKHASFSPKVDPAPYVQLGAKVRF